MIITLYKPDRIYTLPLPEKASGRFFLSDGDGEMRRELARIDGDGISWHMQTDATVCSILKDDAPCSEMELLEGRFYVLRFADGQADAHLYADPADEQRGTFCKYLVQDSCTLTIGRNEGNGLILHSGYISGNHARLIWKDRKWTLEDLESRNGTYVNEQRCTHTELQPGDAICFVGVKLIVGNGILALNNPGGIVEVRDKHFTPMPQPNAQERTDIVPVDRHLFYRAPRFRRVIQVEQLIVDPPPDPEKIEKTPAALLIGPTLTMGMTAVVMAFVAASNYMVGNTTLLNTIPTMIMSLCMLCATVLWPTLTRRYDKKCKHKAEVTRRDKYRAYLEQVQDKIAGVRVEQQSVLNQNYPDTEQWVQRIEARTPELWERTPQQSDFLTIRVGKGTRTLDLDLKGQLPRFTVNRDYLTDDMQRLISIPHNLEDVPITWSLLEHPVSGVIGGAEQIKSFMRLLALQIATFHSYNEVKLILLADSDDIWSETKWLPHTWDEDLRMVAVERRDKKYLSACLEKLSSERAQEQRDSRNQMNLNLPYYIVLAVGRHVFASFDVINQLCASGGNIGFFVVAAVEDRKDLPKECTEIVDLRAQTLFSLDGKTDSGIPFCCDQRDDTLYSAACREMSNISLDLQGQYELPNCIDFLEMCQVGKVEHLNAMERWRQNNPVNSLQAPVGIGTDGELFSLDLHEKVHGPHGLVAGMTGSGKSEFVISLPW